MSKPIILKPCPFCGAQPKTRAGQGLDALVCCERERCAAQPSVYGSTPAAAARRWNRRAKGDT